MKVILVDDDKIIRLGLRKIISRSNKGFDIVGEASNGLDALNLIKSDVPDIVITDIKMPIMNGIDLIKNIHKDNLNCKVIALSGFDEYNFVRDSLKSGAVDYLLKPIDNNELIQTLDNVRKSIESESNIRDTYDDIINESRSIINEKILNNILCGENNDTSSIMIEINDFNIMLISFKVLEKNINGILENIKDILYSNIDEYSNNLIICEYQKHIVILYKTSFKDNIINSLNEVFNNSNIYYNISCIIDNDIRASYEYCIEESLSNFYDNNNCHKSFNCKIYEPEQLQILINNLISDMDIINLDKTCNSFKSLLDYFKIHNIHPNLLKEHLIKIINICRFKLNDFNSAYECIQSEQCIDVIEYIQYINDFNEGTAYLIQLLNNILIQIKNLKNVRSDRIIEYAKDYIKKNYKNALTLTEVANNVYLNPNYLSELFKKEVGKNFIDYLVELRINEAKELLKIPGIKIYTVAAEVGYKEQVSFNRAFKRIVGMSPREYINLIK